MLFAALASTPAEGIDTDNPALDFVHPFADGDTIPSQFTFGTSLASFAQCLNRASHEHAQSTPFEILGRVQQQGFDFLGQFHHLSSKSLFSPEYTIPG